MDSTTPLRNNATGNIQTFVPISGDKFTPRELRYLALYRVDENGCWLFQGEIRSHGYGRAGKYGPAHRFFYTRHIGPIPHPLVLDHLCRVKRCVNPQHLEAVTQLENVRRGQAGRWQTAKTHCSNGHEFTPENTRVYRGCRQCKECGRVASRDYQRKLSAARKAASNG